MTTETPLVSAAHAVAGWLDGMARTWRAKHETYAAPGYLAMAEDLEENARMLRRALAGLTDYCEWCECDAPITSRQHGLGDVWACADCHRHAATEGKYEVRS